MDVVRSARLYAVVRKGEREGMCVCVRPVLSQEMGLRRIGWVAKQGGVIRWLLWCFGFDVQNLTRSFAITWLPACLACYAKVLSPPCALLGFDPLPLGLQAGGVGVCARGAKREGKTFLVGTVTHEGARAASGEVWCGVVWSQNRVGTLRKRDTDQVTCEATMENITRSKLTSSPVLSFSRSSRSQ